VERYSLELRLGRESVILIRGRTELIVGGELQAEIDVGEALQTLEWSGNRGRGEQKREGDAGG
jgi:hypothetical protein